MKCSAVSSESSGAATTLLSLYSNKPASNVRCSTFGLMCWVGNGVPDSGSLTVTLLSNLTHCRFKSRVEWIMMLQRLMFLSRSYSFPHHMEAEQLFTANILCRVRSSHLSVKSAKCFPKSQRVITGSDASIVILIQSESQIIPGFFLYHLRKVFQASCGSFIVFLRTLVTFISTFFFFTVWCHWFFCIYHKYLR